MWQKYSKNLVCSLKICLSQMNFNEAFTKTWRLFIIFGGGAAPDHYISIAAKLCSYVFIPLIFLNIGNNKFFIFSIRPKNITVNISVKYHCELQTNSYGFLHLLLSLFISILHFPDYQNYSRLFSNYSIRFRIEIS